MVRCARICTHGACEHACTIARRRAHRQTDTHTHTLITELATYNSWLAYWSSKDCSLTKARRKDVLKRLNISVLLHHQRQTWSKLSIGTLTTCSTSAFDGVVTPKYSDFLAHISVLLWSTRAPVAVKPRRPPVADVGIETAFRFDQHNHFQKSKHLLRSEVTWCDHTSIDLHLRRSTCASTSE